MYVSIDCNHSFSYSYLIKPFIRVIRKADRRKLQGKALAIEIPPFVIKEEDEDLYPDLIGVSYRIEYFVGEGEVYPTAVAFEWTTPDGTPHKQTINLDYEPSNLGSGYVGYFVCPMTGERCRKLYTDGKVISSRHFNGSRYSYQNESRNARAFRKLHSNSEERREKLAKHRQTYGGKPTRWAIRLAKMEEKESEAWSRLERNFVRIFNGCAQKR